MFFASSFFNSSNVWFGYIANAFFTVGALAAVGKLIQRYFTHHSSQHRNNGGSSSKDQWDRVEHKVDSIGRDLNRHLGYHEGLLDAEDN